MIFEDNKKKILIIGAICIIVIIASVIYLFIQNEEDEYFDFEELESNVENVVQNEINEVIEEKVKIVVHISGQVINPGVISLDEGARIIDAINEAKGLTSEADISKVNLAYVLEDAQKIYIPSINDKEEKMYILEGSGDTEIVTSSGSVQNKKEEKLMVNINTANESELQQLPGIGGSIATRIVSYRKENGKFNSIEDIKNVSGIGESKFNKIKDNICVK